MSYEDDFTALCEWIIDPTRNGERQYMNYSNEYFVAFYGDNDLHTTKSSDKLRNIFIYQDSYIKYKVTSNLIEEYDTNIDIFGIALDTLIITDTFKDWTVTEENYFQYTVCAEHVIPEFELKNLIRIARVLHRKLIEYN